MSDFLFFPALKIQFIDLLKVNFPCKQFHGNYEIVLITFLKVPHNQTCKFIFIT